ncbi:MAG: tetratricopeptide repeat protein [Nitrospinaceae bacterium]
MGQFDQAIEEFLKAIDINSEHIKSYNNIGVVYYLKKSRGIQNYQKASPIILRIRRH